MTSSRILFVIFLLDISTLGGGAGVSSSSSSSTSRICSVLEMSTLGGGAGGFVVVIIDVNVVVSAWGRRVSAVEKRSHDAVFVGVGLLLGSDL